MQTFIVYIRLQITDENNSKTLFRKSGVMEPVMLVTYTSYVRLRFTSDASGAMSGFLIGYSSKNSITVIVTATRHHINKANSYSYLEILMSHAFISFCTFV